MLEKSFPQMPNSYRFIVFFKWAHHGLFLSFCPFNNSSINFVKASMLCLGCEPVTQDGRRRQNHYAIAASLG